MQNELSQLLSEAKEQLRRVANMEEAEKIRVGFLGKKGQLTEILKSMGRLSPEERPVMGKLANEVKAEIEGALENTFATLKSSARATKLKTEKIDVTIPGVRRETGAKHPITLVIDEISDIFMKMGYTVAEGPEVELVYYNFDALNASPDHPSRDLTDTFYIDEKTVLRTQTSPVQVRALIGNKPPVKVIAPGRCFRRDEVDATHSPMFHQIEGLAVDEGITMGDLKGTLETFAKELFGSKLQTKFRPHFFPFTEPSAEMDVSCFKCGGKGCRICKGSGWIEILGCGMVHPNVLKAGKADPEKYSGFAFGLGVERVAMLKYGIDDMRLLYENDMRFITQFK